MVVLDKPNVGLYLGCGEGILEGGIRWFRKAKTSEFGFLFKFLFFLFPILS
jgi:hypothetical protein